MDEYASVNPDPEASPIWPLQYCLAPDDSQSHIRKLIAYDWNRRGQSIESRALILWPIINPLGDLTHCCVAIAGTPWRGIVLVPLCGDDRAVRTGHIAKIFSQNHTRTLREFVSRAIEREMPQ